MSASMRRGSLNGQLANHVSAAVTAASLDWQADPLKLDRLRLNEVAAPNYDNDLESSSPLPDGPDRFAKALAAADAWILSSPEYNASMPGTLKNLVDWVSRIRPQPFAGTRVLLTSASPSAMGGNRGLWALRVPLEQLGVHVFPDMYSLAHARDRLQEPDFLDSDTGHRLTELVRDFLDEARSLRTTPSDV